MNFNVGPSRSSQTVCSQFAKGCSTGPKKINLCCFNSLNESFIHYVVFHYQQFKVCHNASYSKTVISTGDKVVSTYPLWVLVVLF